METLAGPNLLRMVHTRYGAMVAVAVLAYGTPKDRKKAVKAFQGAHWPCRGLLSGIILSDIASEPFSSLSYHTAGRSSGILVQYARL